jgi:hypothetical protein
LLIGLMSCRLGSGRRPLPRVGTGRNKAAISRVESLRKTRQEERWSMMPKSGIRFSENIMLQYNLERDEESKKNHPDEP